MSRHLSREFSKSSSFLNQEEAKWHMSLYSKHASMLQGIQHSKTWESKTNYCITSKMTLHITLPYADANRLLCRCGEPSLACKSGVATGAAQHRLDRGVVVAYERAWAICFPSLPLPYEANRHVLYSPCLLRLKLYVSLEH